MLLNSPLVTFSPHNARPGTTSSLCLDYFLFSLYHLILFLVESLISLHFFGLIIRASEKWYGFKIKHDAITDFFYESMSLISS